MKKILCIVLALLMACCSLVGCSKGSDSDKAKAYDKALAAIGYTADDSLPVLKVAMSPDFAPMEFVDLSRTGNAKYVGFDVLLATYIAKELGMKLEIVPMSFDACIVATQTASVDIALSGFSWTPERAENFLITDWYEAGENETEQVVITTSDKAGKLTKASDFAGLKVGAQGESLQEVLTKEQLPDSECVLYENLNDAVMALMTGKIDALSVAKGNGEAFISANEGKIDFSGFEYVVDELYKNNVGLINKNNTDLLAKVNAALSKAKTANLYADWYEACQILAKIKTTDELGYDDQGNKITE